MAVQADTIYKDREAIVADLIAAWQARVPDMVVTPDSILRIWIEVFANTAEGLYLAAQILHNDIFPQTAQAVALIRYGDLYGRELKKGTKSTGTLRFSGAGGTTVDIGTQVAAPRVSEEALLFNTTALVTIPNPGVPAAPTATDAAAGVLPAGTYEYAVSFVTAGGETVVGTLSNAVTIAINRRIDLSAIPTGGPGTTARKVYRRLNAGALLLVTTINDNTTTTYQDANTAPAGSPLTESTAERVSVAAESDEAGASYNVVTGAITEIADGSQSLTGVTNTTSFTGGSDDEDIEVFRSALLNFIQSPGSGSVLDLKAIAESVDGVDEATVFENDNLGVAQDGHVTVRISGPGGAIPNASVQAATLAALQAENLAGIIIHVATFTQVSRAATVAITVASGYVLADLTASIQQAISDYINSVPVGGTLYPAGIVDAVFGLPGVSNLTVSVPAAPQTHTSTEKPIPGTITVT